MASNIVIKNHHQKLSSKIVIKNCYQKMASNIVIKNRHQKLSPQQSDQMSQWSQVPRIALCMAKVKVSEWVTQWVSEWVTQWVTRSPIELFWTAKKVFSILQQQDVPLFKKKKSIFSKLNKMCWVPRDWPDRLFTEGGFGALLLFPLTSPSSPPALFVYLNIWTNICEQHCCFPNEGRSNSA